MDGNHFKAIIVSDNLEGGVTRQLVYRVSGEGVSAEIRALSMQTYSQVEWDKKGNLLTYT